jgi:integrase
MGKDQAFAGGPKSLAGSRIREKVIHELRHTLGTLTNRSFPKRMVQATMGHQSETSSAAHWHPDEEMAAEVRQTIVAELSQNFTKGSKRIKKQQEPA